jgi:hypothetical protein
MALFNLYIDLDKEYINLINDLYKIIVILIVFQIIIHFSDSPKNIINNALLGSLLNDDFMTLLIYIIISISAYYLVFSKIISFDNILN